MVNLVRPRLNKPTKPIPVSTTTNTSQKNQSKKDIVVKAIPKKGLDYFWSKYDKFEFSTYDLESNLISEPFTKKYDLIANAKWNSFNTCIESKNSLKNIMKDTYRNNKLNPKPERVLVNINHYLRASLGKNDAINLPWDDAGPSLFFEIVLKYRPYEYTDSPLHSRTWGKLLNSECK